MLKKSYFAALAVALGLWTACNGPYQKPSDPTEAGRDFINATLKADYAVADQYILQDSNNKVYYQRYKEWYSEQPDSQKEGYRKASLVIYGVAKPTDSTAIITFANTYMNRRDSIRMVKTGGEWWVDFAHGLADTSSVH
jgi:hypothetical protein